MDILSALISILVFCLVVVFVIYQFNQITYSIRPKKIPHLPSPSKKLTPILTEIINEYVPSTKEVYFIEYGAGLSQISANMSRQLEWRGVIAIEYDTIIYTLARLLRIFHRPKILFVNGDVFDTKMPKESVIFCYLNHTIMCYLYEEGYFDSMLVFSLSCPIPNLTPDKSINIGGISQDLFVYNFLDQNKVTKSLNKPPDRIKSETSTIDKLNRAKKPIPTNHKQKNKKELV